MMHEPATQEHEELDEMSGTDTAGRFHGVGLRVLVATLATLIVVLGVGVWQVIGTSKNDTGIHQKAARKSGAAKSTTSTSSTTQSVTTTSAGGASTVDGYPLVNAMPNPIPASGIFLNSAEVIMTPGPSDPPITSSQALADASKYANNTWQVVGPVSTYLSIPGTQNNSATGSIDGHRTYPRVWGLLVWVVAFKSPQPERPYIYPMPPPNETPQQIEKSKRYYNSLPAMNYYAIAIDATNGDFVRGFWYQG